MILEACVASIIVKSVFIAVIASVSSTYLGYLIACINFTNFFYFKHIIRYLVILLFFLPSQVYVLSLIQNFGSYNSTFTSSLIDLLYSNIGITVVLIFLNFPISFLIFENNLKTIDVSMIKQAYINGANSVDVFIKIVTPLIKSNIYKVKFLIFINAFGNFSVPYLLGRSKQIELFIPYLVNKLKSFAPYDIGFIGLILSFSIFCALLGWFIDNSSKSSLYNQAFTIANNTQLRKSNLSITYILINFSILIFLFFIVVFPLTTLVLNSFSGSYNSFLSSNTPLFQNYIWLLNDHNLFIKPIARTICISLVIFATLFSMSLILGFFQKIRLNIVLVKWINTFGVLIHALPGTFIAIIIMCFFFLNKDFLNLKLLFAYFIKFFWPTSQVVRAVSDKLPTMVLQQAYIYTNNKILIFSKVYIPIVISTIVPAFLLITIMVIKELNIAILLTNYENITIGPALLSFFESGEFNLSATYSISLIVLILFSSIIIRIIGIDNKCKK